MPDIVTNRKARRDFDIVETFEAGVVLRGSEVKSLRAGHAQLADAFARIDGGEVFLHNAHIDPYDPANRENHQPAATRKLLLKRSEIRRLAALVEVKGNALVPLRFYWQNRKVKLSLGVGRGKQQYDKREDLKRREGDLEARRATMHRLKGR